MDGHTGCMQMQYNAVFVVLPDQLFVCLSIRFVRHTRDLC